MSDGGKGSLPRPYGVSQEQFGNNWDAIFGKKKVESEPKEEYRINKQGQHERFREGQWELDPTRSI